MTTPTVSVVARVHGRLAGWDERRVAAALGVSSVAVYLLLTVGHSTPFDYFGRLAYALWQGRYWLDGAPLSEIQPGLGGHFYNVQPPLPALLALPLVPFGRADQIEVFVSALAGGLSIVPLYLALRALTVPRSLAIWCALLSSFGTTLLYTSVEGRAWFAANTTAMLFATIALWLAATKRSPLVIGMAIGVAALGRTAVALAAPGLLLLARRDMGSFRELPRAALLFVLGGSPFGVIQGLYDLVRWGDPLDIYGPQHYHDNEPAFARGMSSLSYVPRKIYAILFEAPRFVDGEPFFFLRPRAYGTSLVVTTPAYLWLVAAVARLRSDARWRAIALSAGLAAVPGLVFATTGWDQYGYRYSLDVQPFLIALVAVGASWNGSGWSKPSGIFRFVLVLSIIVTWYFFITIKRFGLAP